MNMTANQTPERKKRIIIQSKPSIVEENFNGFIVGFNPLKDDDVSSISNYNNTDPPMQPKL